MDPRTNQRHADEKDDRRAGRTRLSIRAVSIAALGFSLLLPASLVRAGQQPPQEPTEQPTQAPGQPAQATSRVTVQGTVRNSVTGEPLPRALVQIEGDADTGTLTDGEGRFEIPGVPTGAQTIRVVKPGFRDRPYPTEEPGVQSEGPAHSVLVAAQMPDLTFALAPNCAIHGRIELSTGDPAMGMTVVLLKRIVRFGHNIWAVESTARTNGDGAYRLGGLPDGEYILQTQPTLESEPAVSVVAPGSAAHIVRNGYASVFYPDAHDLAGASRIRLPAGSQAEANFSLPVEPFYPVTAFAGGPSDPSVPGKSAGQNPYTAEVMDASGQVLSYPVQYDSITHSLQASLPNGSYTLVVHGAPTLNSFQPTGFGPLRSAAAQGLAGAAEFTVAGHAIAGLRIPVGQQQAATVHLRFVHNSDSPTAAAAFSAGQADQTVNVNIDPAGSPPPNGFESVWSMSSQQDSISITAQPGTYWLSANILQKGVCAGPLTAAGANLAREPLAVSLASTPPPMELTLRDDCGTLTLTLPGALAAFLPGEEPFYTVYVVPDFDTVLDIPPMTVHASSGPTLTIDDLTPGSYHVYAFNSPVHLAYRESAILAALPISGQQVTISAGTTTSVVLEGLEH